MKTLILMRHAEAVSEGSARTDFERPLTEDGRAMAAKTALLLSENELVPSRILASAALRTMQTAQVVAQSICPDAGLLALDELYLSTAVAYANAASNYAQEEDSVILVVGHNPGIARLMRQWSDQSFPVPPTTTVAFSISAAEWAELVPEDPPPMRVVCVIRDAAVSCT